LSFSLPPSIHPYCFTPEKYLFFSLFFSFTFLWFFILPCIQHFYKTSFWCFLSFWKHFKTRVGQWIVPLHVPYTLSLFFTPKNYSFFLLLSFHFYDSLVFHVSSIFYKTSFQSFWVFGSISKLGCKIGCFEGAPSQGYKTQRRE
jgi:hypothetical protein